MAVVLVAGLVLRHQNLMRGTVPGGVQGAFVLYEALRRDRARRLGAGASERAASIARLAVACGIPRETTRRLVAALARDGWLDAAPGAFPVPTARARTWFSLADDSAGLGDFVWVAHCVRRVLSDDAAEADPLVAQFPWRDALATQRECLPHPPHGPLLARLHDGLRDRSPEDRERIADLVDGFHHRHMLRVCEVFGRDPLLPLLIGEIAHRNVSALASIAAATARPLDDTIEAFNAQPDALMRGANAHSLSLAMGIPDATVRRKVQRLADRGWVQIGANGQLTIRYANITRVSSMIDALSVAEILAVDDEVAATCDKLGLAVAPPPPARSDAPLPHPIVRRTPPCPPA